MLPDDKRTQLDGIVQHMVANKESDSNIRFVVDDFKQKYTTAAPATPVAPQKDLLQKAGDVVSSIFPGGALGKAVGTGVAGIAGTIGKLAHGDLEGAAHVATQGAQDVNSQFLPASADALNAAITPASALVGGPAGTGVKAIAGRVATNAAVGASIGGLNAAANGKDITTNAMTGAALGGAFSALGEGVNSAVNALPNRLLKQALPKLSPGNEEYALKQTKIGSVATNLEISKASVSHLGEQVKHILTHPEYANDTGAGDFAIKKTLNAFPNSAYSRVSVISSIKKLVPGQATLVDKVANGTATLLEKNTLRQNLDPVIKKVFTDTPQVTPLKEIGAEFANALRGEVQSHAPETAPVFANLSKEIDLRKALQVMAKRIDGKKALGLYDIVAGLGGFATLGPAGAVAAIGGEKLARSPGVGIAAAKGAKALSKSLPTANAIGRAAKAPLINASTNRQ